MNSLLFNFLSFFFNLKRNKKIYILFLLDLFISFFSIITTYFFLYNSFIFSNENFIVILISSYIYLFYFYIFKIYRLTIRYIKFRSILEIYLCIILFTLNFIIILYFLELEKFNYIFATLYALIFSLLLIVSRITVIVFYDYLNIKINSNKKVLIFCNINEIDNLIRNYSLKFKIEGFIIDLPNIPNKINNIKCLSLKDIKSYCIKKNINNILISYDNDIFIKREKIIETVHSLKINIKVIENKDFSNSLLFENNIEESINALNVVNRHIDWDMDSMKSEIFNKTIFISGGGGSIGSQLALQVLLFNPKKIILIDNSEYNLYKIKDKIENNNNYNKYINKIEYHLTSVNNSKYLEKIFDENKVIDVIIHAAAYKHVNIIENNLLAAIKTNFFGTINLLNLSIKYNSNKFLFVSTDKAVKPSNFMGFTKRISEMYLLEKSKNINLKIGAVRFGNVLGSAGSVIPLFIHQINNKLPITITHPDVTRYFMTIPEAAGLLIQSLSIFEDGKIFFLDMGKPIKIIDIAKKLIFMSGLLEKNKLNPHGDIPIIITGLKKGEKMHEDLSVSNKFISSKYSDIFIDKFHEIDSKISSFLFKEIEDCYNTNNLEGLSKIFDKYRNLI